MAARGINKVIIVGNLGKDPETRFTPSGSAITNITVATSETWRDKNTGENQERTEWHRITFYNKLAEIAGEYLKKGSKVYLEGRLQTRKWQAQDGSDRWTTEIIANEMQMLDSRGAGTDKFAPPAQPGGYQQQSPAAQQQSQYQQQAQQQQPQQYQQPPQQQQPQQYQQGAQQPVPAMDDFDDDIPF